MRKICGSRRVVPSDFRVSGTLSGLEGDPIAHGGFCDAYKGSLDASSDVCIKKLRMFSNDDQEKRDKVSHPHSLESTILTESFQTMKLFCKEAVIWGCLNHPNIVPFKGVTLDPPQLVSEWMPGGELRKYVRNNAHADPVDLVGQFPPLFRTSPNFPFSCLELLRVLHISIRTMLYTGTLKGYACYRQPCVRFLTKTSTAKYRC